MTKGGALERKAKRRMKKKLMKGGGCHRDTWARCSASVIISSLDVTCISLTDRW